MGKGQIRDICQFYLGDIYIKKGIKVIIQVQNYFIVYRYYVFKYLVEYVEGDFLNLILLVL